MRWPEGTGVSTKTKEIVEYLHEDTATALDAVPLVEAFRRITRSHSR